MSTTFADPGDNEPKRVEIERVPAAQGERCSCGAMAVGAFLVPAFGRVPYCSVRA